MMHDAKKEEELAIAGFRRGSAVADAVVDDMPMPEMRNESYATGYYTAIIAGLLGYYFARHGESMTRRLLVELLKITEHGLANAKSQSVSGPH